MFAGTTEGRELAQYLYRCGVSCDICVATEYGEALLEECCEGHRIHRGRLDAESMAALAAETGATHIVDATHPYAEEVSSHIRACCDTLGLPYLRLIRPELSAEQEALTVRNLLPVLKESNLSAREDVLRKVRGRGCIYSDSVEEAVQFLNYTQGPVLAATGSKELWKYRGIAGWEERVFARVLSTAEAVEKSSETGFCGKHLICMQGPFSTRMNLATLEMTGAKWMVTKESGHAGGFAGKLEAAAAAGAVLVVVGRPLHESGFSPVQIRRYLNEVLHLVPRRKVTLAGIGPGDESEMTEKVKDALREADLVIGAGRMLESALTAMPSVSALEEYRADRIVRFLSEHPEYERIVVVLSGDPGFYSGGASLRKELQRELPATRIRTLAGISSVSRLCALLGTEWEDAVFASMHGRADNIPGLVYTNAKVFVLLGKEDSFHRLCRSLLDYGLDEVRISAGCRLSYPDEQVMTGLPGELLDKTPGDLTVVMILNEKAQSVPAFGLPDDAFLRTEVPMTKSEIRALSLSRLRLCENSIVYDIGAGTGSVSAEIGRMIPGGQVFAIEKRDDAADLIRRNAGKLCAPCVEVVRGTAPEAFLTLPAPTHAFIGGSGGRLNEILKALLAKNSEIRIVINAISLETVSEVTACIGSLELEEEEIICVNVSRAKKTGRYHLMHGQNPVYIITLNGSGRNRADGKQ